MSITSEAGKKAICVIVEVGAEVKKYVCNYIHSEAINMRKGKIKIK